MVDLVHTVLVDRLHRSKGYAIWSVDSEMDGSGGLGCFTWPEQGSDAVAAIGDGGSLLAQREKGLGTSVLHGNCSGRNRRER